MGDYQPEFNKHVLRRKAIYIDTPVNCCYRVEGDKLIPVIYARYNCSTKTYVFSTDPDWQTPSNWLKYNIVDEFADLYRCYKHSMYDYKHYLIEFAKEGKLSISRENSSSNLHKLAMNIFTHYISIGDFPNQTTNILSELLSTREATEEEYRFYYKILQDLIKEFIEKNEEDLKCGKPEDIQLEKLQNGEYKIVVHEKTESDLVIAESGNYTIQSANKIHSISCEVNSPGSVKVTMNNGMLKIENLNGVVTLN